MYPDLSVSTIESNVEIGIIQYGEGNFLRAFADWMIHKMRENANYGQRVALVQPIQRGRVAELATMHGRYHHVERRGDEPNTATEPILIDVFEAFIDPYSNCQAYLALGRNSAATVIISNTTEAGIQFDPIDEFRDQPAASFPGKLTQLLYERYAHFPDKGFSILPTELIDRNGDKLKECVLKYVELWDLGDTFRDWVNQSNSFYNTLVDRIVPGHPSDDKDSGIKALVAKDPFCVAAEQYHLWVIEAHSDFEHTLPLQKSGLNVVYTDDLETYRTRKVRILNGSHMALVALGLHFGLETVRDAIFHPQVAVFLKGLLNEEILPSLPGDADDQLIYANTILERFKNPYIEHKLRDISLNAFSKLQARILPSIIDYHRLNDAHPKRLLAILVAFTEMYQDAKRFTPQDTAEIEDKIVRLKSQFSGDDQLVTRLKILFRDQSIWGHGATILETMVDSAADAYRMYWTKNDVLSTK